MDFPTTVRPASVDNETWAEGIPLLVVDDHPEILRLVERLLSGCCIVHTTTSGEEALELLERVDMAAILLDVRMPAPWTGLRTLSEIRTRHPDLVAPVIAFTAHTLRYEKKLLLAEGFDDYLGKPFVQGDLLEVLDRYIDWQG